MNEGVSMSVSLENIVKRGGNRFRNAIIGLASLAILGTGCHKDTTAPNVISTHPVWQELSAQTITEDSPDSTIIYRDLKRKASFDGSILFTANSTHFNPYFEGNDLQIKSMLPDWNGSEQVKVYANNIESSFLLTVTPVEDPTRWIRHLPDIVLDNFPQNNSIIIHNLSIYASDPDTPLAFAIQGYYPYSLFIQDNAIRIANVSETYFGTEQVTLNCNELPATFSLTIKQPIFEKIYESETFTQIIDGIFSNENFFIIHHGGIEELRNRQNFSLIRSNDVGTPYRAFTDTGNFIFIQDVFTIEKKDRTTYASVNKKTFEDQIYYNSANSQYLFTTMERYWQGELIKYFRVSQTSDFSIVGIIDINKDMDTFQTDMNETEVIITGLHKPTNSYVLEIRTMPEFSFSFSDTIQGQPHDYMSTLSTSQNFILFRSNNRIKLYQRHTHQLIWAENFYPYIQNAFISDDYLCLCVGGELTAIYDLETRKKRMTLPYTFNLVTSAGFDRNILYGENSQGSSDHRFVIYRLTDSSE